MLYAKKDYPEEDTLVLCTITSVQYNSVFCDLDEFPKNGGMIHISEVTAGRIRNIRDYVQEGRKVVCKVLRIDKEKGHIDLSLRRVNERQRREKITALKQEQKAENLLTYIAKETKQDMDKLYAAVTEVVFKEYEYLFEAFQDIVDEKYDLEKAGLEKKLATKITALVKERIKPPEVTIEGKITVTTFTENGVQLVKDALIAARDATESGDIRYLGAGQYKFSVTAEEYKDAEKRLQAGVAVLEKAFKKIPASTLAFARVNE